MNVSKVTKDKKTQLHPDKGLYRSVKNRMLGGVAGGLADYFSIDPTIIRLIFVLLVVFGGSGILIYFILWIVIPSAGSSNRDLDETVRMNADEIRERAENFAGSFSKESSNQGNRSLFGIIILVLGVLFLLNNFGVWRIFDLSRMWPVILILLGLAIFLKDENK